MRGRPKKQLSQQTILQELRACDNTLQELHVTPKPQQTPLYRAYENLGTEIIRHGIDALAHIIFFGETLHAAKNGTPLETVLERYELTPSAPLVIPLSTIQKRGIYIPQTAYTDLFLPRATSATPHNPNAGYPSSTAKT
ncbi:hypothetical protein CMO92_01480 [Candidatus Woesearchaeota archaeon]|nr:hypothetical protein [Candidatus Woesearchaeota archaeon]